MKRTINNPPRRPLQDIIPVPAPFRVNLEPTNICNIRCQFCPTGTNPPGSPKKGRMEWGLFTKIIGELATIGAPKFLNWYFFGEPLLHPKFPEMVAYAKAHLPGTKHWVATNGVLLRGVLARQIADAPLDRICIGIEEVSAAGYKRIADVTIDYDRLKRDLALFYEMRPRACVYIKTVDHGQSQQDKDKFYADFGNSCDEIDIETLHTQNCVDGEDFLLGAQRLPSRDGRTWQDKKVCPFIFYHPAITWDGIVVPCSEDWSRSMPLGDLRTQTFSEVWHGESLQALRLSHLRGERMSHKACTNCDLIAWNPDNVDEHRQELALRLATVAG